MGDHYASGRSSGSLRLSLGWEYSLRGARLPGRAEAEPRDLERMGRGARYMGEEAGIQGSRAVLMNIYFDLEFTGLHQKTTLVSLGCISDDSRRFYAEATDYDRSQVSPWIQENVIGNLTSRGRPGPGPYRSPFEADRLNVLGTRSDIGSAFREWISQFGPVEFWG